MLLEVSYFVVNKMFLCVVIETTAHQLHPIKETFWHFFN